MSHLQLCVCSHHICMPEDPALAIELKQFQSLPSCSVSKIRDSCGVSVVGDQVGRQSAPGQLVLAMDLKDT